MKNKKLEALSWLKKNKNEYPFASNFFEKKIITKFVKDLYEAGAEHVEIDGIYDEDWRIKKEGGPYADTLLIHFPKKLLNRLKILGLIMQTGPDEIDDLNETRNIDWTKVSVVRLWWD